jgi:hypothetical protein
MSPAPDELVNNSKDKPLVFEITLKVKRKIVAARFARNFQT